MPQNKLPSKFRLFYGRSLIKLSRCKGKKISKNAKTEPKLCLDLEK